MKYTDIAAMAKQANFITANPVATALGAGTIAGIASQVGGNLLDRREENKAKEPIKMNPLDSSKQTNINNGIAGAAGIATTAGLYAALGKMPIFKRRKILKAVIATLGGIGVGSTAWNMANNYQNNTRNS